MKKLIYGMTLVLAVTSLAGCTSKKNTTSEIVSVPDRYDDNAVLEPAYEQYMATIFNNCGYTPDVWKNYRGKGVTIAVIDSGFDYTHPEFYYADGTSKASDKSAYLYTDNDGNIQTRVGVENVGITDQDSHGTMCASLAVASINNVGMVGMAPEATVMFVKIDKKATSMAAAFSYAADNGAKVICTSLGDYNNSSGGGGDIIYPAGFDLSTAFNEDIKYAHEKGCVVVAAAGNSFTTELTYPAACEYVIGAGGVIASDSHRIWGYSAEGSNYNGDVQYVDCYAPSNRIYAAGYDYSKKDHTYWTNGKGTSFASPLIAGAACLYFEKHPDRTNTDFEKDLEETCFDLTEYNKQDMGWGQLDTVALLER